MPTPSAIDFEPEPAREADDRLGDRGVLRVRLEIGDEGNVDLERVDREVLQVRQRRIAGAEVVDGDGETLVAELVQHLADRVEVVQQAGLGHLELDPRRIAADVAHDLGDPLREVLAVELARRKIDRHGEVHPLRAPRDALLRRGFQHPFAERVDEA